MRLQRATCAFEWSLHRGHRFLVSSDSARRCGLLWSVQVDCTALDSRWPMAARLPRFGLAAAAAQAEDDQTTRHSRCTRTLEMHDAALDRTLRWAVACLSSDLVKSGALICRARSRCDTCCRQIFDGMFKRNDRRVSTMSWNLCVKEIRTMGQLRIRGSAEIFIQIHAMKWCSGTSITRCVCFVCLANRCMRRNGQPNLATPAVQRGRRSARIRRGPLLLPSLGFASVVFVGQLPLPRGIPRVQKARQRSEAEKRGGGATDPPSANRRDRTRPCIDPPRAHL